MRGALTAALLLGVLQAFAFAPFELWWLQPLSLAGLAWLAWDAPWRRAAGLGFAFGAGWLGAGLWWLYISLHDFGGLAPPLALHELCDSPTSREGGSGPGLSVQHSVNQVPNLLHKPALGAAPTHEMCDSATSREQGGRQGRSARSPRPGQPAPGSG